MTIIYSAISSWTVLKHFVFKENIKCVLSSYGFRQPTWNFDIEILLSCSLSKDFFELIDKQLVFLFKIIKISIFILDFSLLFFKLMFHGVGFILMNTIKLINLFFSISFHIINLIFNQRVKLLLFSIPSNTILSKLSSKLFFTWFNKCYLLVTCSDLIIFYLKIVLKLFYDLLVFFNLLFKIF